MSFNDSAFRVINTGDSTYYRPSREAADRAACECLRHGGRECNGVIEAKSGQGWVVVARYAYGSGITDEPGAPVATKPEDWTVTEVTRKPAGYSAKSAAGDVPLELISFKMSYQGGAPEQLVDVPFAIGTTMEDLVRWCAIDTGARG